MIALDDKAWPAFDLSESSPIFQTYRDVVKQCFDQELHGAILRDSSKTVDERRTFIYQNIVHPLKELLLRLKWEGAINDMEPMNSTEAVTPKGLEKSLSSMEYTVGWVCALPVELAAAKEMLDEEYLGALRGHDDEDIYTLGKIAEHNVVIACLPAGQYGTNSAAAVAMRMRAKFPSLRFGLLVGIGGGVPSSEADIRLGDVVISQPDKGRGGVVQYDLGKNTPSGFSPTGFLNTPPPILLSALANMRADCFRGRTSIHRHLSTMLQIPDFSPRNAGPDVLFQPNYKHGHGHTCQMCSPKAIIPRLPRNSRDINIHYGTIASGNQVIKDAKIRDSLSDQLGGVLCFEMEAAGLMNSFPCLVIRGICDYADTHKNKRWQPYASATAAACAKELLCLIPKAEVATARTMG